MTRRDAWMLTGLTLLLTGVVILATALGTANVPPLRAMRILWDVLTGNEVTIQRGSEPFWCGYVYRAS
jgi:Tat (twin-arginine translocation) pathway signal sequence